MMEDECMKAKGFLEDSAVKEEVPNWRQKTGGDQERIQYGGGISTQISQSMKRGEPLRTLFSKVSKPVEKSEIEEIEGKSGGYGYRGQALGIIGPRQGGKGGERNLNRSEMLGKRSGGIRKRGVPNRENCKGGLLL